MATNENDDPPVLDLRTMEELYQPTLNGRGRPIPPITIQATNFGIKNDMIQQVQNSCQFHGLPGDDANKPLDKLLHVTQTIKVNGVTDDAFCLYLFPHSLTHHATAWFDRLPRNSINTFEQMAKMFLGKYFPPSMVTKLRNEITNFCQRPDESLFEAWEQIVALKAEMAEINKNLMKVLQINQQVKAVVHNCKTCGGPYYYNDCPATVGQTQNVYATEAYNQTNMTSLINSKLELKNMFGQFMKMNTASYSGLGTLPSNTITNPKEDLKGITTQSGTAYKGPTIPTTYSSPPKVVERETEVTKDMVPSTNNGSTKDVQPLVVHTETPIPNSKPVVAPIVEPVVAPVSALKLNQKPSKPYPSRLHDQNLCDKANDQKEIFFKIFQYLNFNISFADALILKPKFVSTIKSLLTKKDNLFELARTPLNEHCLAVLLKKLPEKLGDPGKFLIPCDFLRMDECLALADLSTSINLMQLLVWNKLSLPELSPTCITLDLVDRLISRSVGVAEDVFVKLRSFHFPADFVVVDYDADPRVPLILRRSFLKTERALIDVYEGELTLRVGKEVVTFNLDQTSRYSANYDDMSVNRIDLIDVPCEEYSKKFLDFFDFLLEETDAFLAIDDEPISSEIDDCYYDSEGDILLLEEFLNDDPSSPTLPP
nr:reverse transcriptase domain-containing protein [Tanacetum cinerariifolium]